MGMLTPCSHQGSTQERAVYGMGQELEEKAKPPISAATQILLPEMNHKA